jgi:chemotaxis methyl-accepting protein methylase
MSGSTCTRVRESVRSRISRSRFLRRYLGRPYRRINVWIWNHLPSSVRSSGLGRVYGIHLHSLIQLREIRRQYVGTFFFRNRPELELLIRLLDRQSQGSTIGLAILACSKGTEVYSFAYAIRRARPELKVRFCALDISENILEFAKAGVFSLKNSDGMETKGPNSRTPAGDVATNTGQDQSSWIFERMSSEEMQGMFNRDEDQVAVKSQFREGIIWLVGDARDPGLVGTLGLQDIVVANRFLCHMYPRDAEECLRNIARLVKPGGYLFVSGVDLDVRSKVAREMGWRPVTELIREIHEGDPSLRRGWPLEYWALEPFDQNRTDWKIRYASVFQTADPKRSERK